MSTFFLFLDIETPGLNPKTDSILEIAWAITDEHFKLHFVPETYLVHPGDGYWANLFHELDLASREVVKMHAESGLLEDIYHKPVNDNYWRKLGNIDTMISSQLTALPEGSTVHLAGSSVHFDKSFLLANNVSFVEPGEDAVSLLHHRILDLSAIKLFLTTIDVPFEQAINEGPHRALNDVLADVEQAVIYRELILNWWAGAEQIFDAAGRAVDRQGNVL